jgi:hypothetical protein
MNKKLIAGACLAVVLAVGGILALTLLGDDPPGQARGKSPTSAETTPAGSASGAASPPSAISGSPAAPGAVPFPTPSLPAGSEDAETVMAINQIIFEITQDAINRPKDQRMTSEEINALIQSRIKELRKSP